MFLVFALDEAQRVTPRRAVENEVLHAYVPDVFPTQMIAFQLQCNHNATFTFSAALANAKRLRSAGQSDAAVTCRRHAARITNASCRILLLGYGRSM